MLELVERVLDILRHGYVTGPNGVIPRNSQATLEVPGPINGGGVQLFQCLDQVVS